MKTSHNNFFGNTALRMFGGWLAVLLLLACLAGSARADEVLNNKSVIDLHNLNLGDPVILQKINSSKCDFDTSVDGIISLKKANLSDAIIEAMIAKGPAAAPAAPPEPSSPPPPAPPTPDTAQPGPPPPGPAPAPPASAPFDVNNPNVFHPPGIWLYEMKDGKPRMTQLFPEGFDISRVNVPFVYTADAVLSGTRATVSTSGSRPVFYIYAAEEFGFWAVNPGELPLIHLDVKDKPNTKDRHIQISRAGPFGGSNGIEAKAMCPLTSQPLGNGIYKVTPAGDLADGEYAFCWLVGRTRLARMYTFGVHSN